jgi:putative nucleotidyltransferase with HDIG domain
MRVVQTGFLKAGDVIGKSLYAENGNLLLGKGIVLTDSLIKKIKDNQIFCLYVDDEFSEGIEPRGIIDDETMVKSIQSIKETMHSLLKSSTKTKMAGRIPIKQYLAVENIVNELIKSLEENKGALYTVTELMGTDMYTYKHSINVAILSILVARSMGYSDVVVKHIAMGGLLHDIGKVKIVPELVNKKGELTIEEFEEMKKHPEYGFEMVKDDRVLAGIAKSIIRYHHEKRDGSGYVSHLEKEDIPEYVGIVTVCDMYDAMTTDRSYRKRMPIYTALETLMCEAIYKIDPQIYRYLVENICIFPVGSMVVLSDGRKAIIIEYRRESPTRPIIKIDEPPYSIIDLEAEKTLFIVDSLT